MHANRLAAMAAVSKLTLVGATASPALAATGEATVEELVVTAQKRGERLQDVPLAVTAFSEKAMDRAQIEDATDIQLSIPNALLTGNDRFTLRCVRTNALGSSNLGVQSFVNGAAIGYLPQNEFFDWLAPRCCAGSRAPPTGATRPAARST